MVSPMPPKVSCTEIFMMKLVLSPMYMVTRLQFMMVMRTTMIIFIVVIRRPLPMPRHRRRLGTLEVWNVGSCHAKPQPSTA